MVLYQACRYREGTKGIQLAEAALISHKQSKWVALEDREA